MKLRKAIRHASMAGAAVMALSAGNTMAAGVDFDGWTVSGGTITPTTTFCDGTVHKCTTLNSGAGFLQQQVDDGTSVYIQTIITEQDADSAVSGTTTVEGSAGVAYSDESFVKADGASPGILSKQSVSDTQYSFQSDTSLVSGWAAQTAGVATLNIAQSFADPGTTVTVTNPDSTTTTYKAGDAFSNKFNLIIDSDAASGNVVGKAMSLDQSVEMGDGTTRNTTDVQAFVARQLSGTKLTTDGTVTLVDGNEATNDTVTWIGDSTTTTGDEVMMVWLGQAVKIGDAPDDSDVSFYGYQSVDNKTTNTSASTFTDAANSAGTLTAAAAPFSWNTLFNTAYDPDLTTPELPVVDSSVVP